MARTRGLAPASARILTHAYLFVLLDAALRGQGRGRRIVDDDDDAPAVPASTASLCLLDDVPEIGHAQAHSGEDERYVIPCYLFKFYTADTPYS